MLCVVVEETDRVIGARRITTLSSPRSRPARDPPASGGAVRARARTPGAGRRFAARTRRSARR
jgi:hypothetical protein